MAWRGLAYRPVEDCCLSPGGGFFEDSRSGRKERDVPSYMAA